MATKLEFLDTLSIFKNLSQEELEALADIANEYEFDDGAIIAYQRDPADDFYIVKEGRLYARQVGEQGVVRDSRSYYKGDHFQDKWLFNRGVHSATVQATSKGRLLTINRQDFLVFLEKQRRALQNLEPEYTELGDQKAGLSEEAWAEAQKSHLAPVTQRYSEQAGLMPGELVEYASRRSVWLVILKLVPLFLVFGLLLGVFFYLRPLFPILTGMIVTAGVSGGLILIFVLLMLYQYIDWANDYFLITTRHIMHYEFNLSLNRYGSLVNKTPIDQVQSVEVEVPNLLANLLGVGTVRITTAAQSGILYFDYISDPNVVHQTINSVRQQVREVDAGREQAVMRESLETHFHTEASYTPVSDVAAPSQPPAPVAASSFWGNLTRRYSYRVVEGNMVTYRKHFFVLLPELRYPLLASAGLLFVLFLLAGIFPEFWSPLVIFLVIIIALAIFGWIGWHVEDWRNDTFQVTPQYVIDIDRSPFGTGETRTQAQLSNVQNISSDRPGLLPTIFNYGNVYIETAGASANITFESVVNPNQVQRDIFERREAFKQQQATRSNEQRRKEFALMLDVYQQAIEQGRIPRRTPPSDIEG